MDMMVVYGVFFFYNVFVFVIWRVDGNNVVIENGSVIMKYFMWEMY